MRVSSCAITIDLLDDGVLVGELVGASFVDGRPEPIVSQPETPPDALVCALLGLLVPVPLAGSDADQLVDVLLLLERARARVLVAAEATGLRGDIGVAAAHQLRHKLVAAVTNARKVGEDIQWRDCCPEHATEPRPERLTVNDLRRVDLAARSAIAYLDSL